MSITPLRQQPSWKALEQHHAEIGTVHLRELFAQDPARGEHINVSADLPARRGLDRCPAPGRVSDSGEGRWTVLAAIDEGVPAAVITAALNERFQSRGRSEFADKLLSAMRSEFGGHAEKGSQP